jgi:hypothetical protein
MAKQSKTVHKKSRGRPAGTKYSETIPARLEPATVASLDAWAASHDVSRSEAIRRLVELGLKVRMPARPVIKPGRRLRAQELATKVIEKIIDPTAPPEEKAQRRRRLTKGPTEFREDRVDLPKAKGK